VWFPSVTWLAVIALESTNLGLCRTYWADSVSDLSFFVRDGYGEVCHVACPATQDRTRYRLLHPQLLLFRSWRATFPRLSTRWCLQWATVALLSTSLVAILDEWHQTFLLSRTGAFRDVILDSTAGLVAQIAIFTMLRTLVSHD